MTPIESIWEIRQAVLDLKKYLDSKDDVVRHRAKKRYSEWVDRFFRENKNYLAPQQRDACLNNLEYFLSLLDDAESIYSE